MKNPFVGLRPFESEESLYYFGRSEQTKALLQQLHGTRFLAVVGSSGSGKSSLVRAGLIPILEAGFLVQDRDLWHIAKMKPGDQPIYNLACALLKVFEEQPLEKQFKAFADSLCNKGVHTVLEKIAHPLNNADSNMLLLIDQFEEIFRFGLNTSDSAKRDEASEFVALLLRLSEQTEAPVYVCLTMRSDYLGDCDAFHGLPEAMNRSQYLVPRLTRWQRREAIEGPIRLSGAKIAPRLVDRLLNESSEYRDDLPVLQHALMRAWNQWTETNDEQIDNIHYEEIGTLKHALSQHANEALKELTLEEQLLAKRLFQILTETDPANLRIRRPAQLSEIATISNATPERVMQIIQKFRADSRNFLVLSSENPAVDPMVDISHESLIRQWETLTEWVIEEAESAKIYQRLAETADLYNQGKAGLYREADLQIALAWREREKPLPVWGKRYYNGFDDAIKFLDKSRSAREAEVLERKKQRAEKEHLLREKAELLEKQSHQQKKALFQTRIFTVVMSVLFLIAIYFTFIAIRNSKEARQQSLAANYNLAKVFEGKAINNLDEAQRQNNFDSYKNAWLFTTAALKQDIDPDSLFFMPISYGRLFDPETIKIALSEKWFSPSANFHWDA
ncbi:MAG: hypothetical protein JSW07_05440, partial [bacterium]